MEYEINQGGKAPIVDVRPIGVAVRLHRSRANVQSAEATNVYRWEWIIEEQVKPGVYQVDIQVNTNSDYAGGDMTVSGSTPGNAIGDTTDTVESEYFSGTAQRVTLLIEHGGTTTIKYVKQQTESVAGVAWGLAMFTLQAEVIVDCKPAKLGIV